ncbi:MAG TPA: protein-glutamate O-methyltransferase CheR [Clostridia bacterium]|nr:protein-glutamate O-methyltransferase CheR [Clostridia bacterium]
MHWSYGDFTKAFFKLTQIDLSCYKERQMKRRIDSLISRHNYVHYEDYYRALNADKTMLGNFIDYITINVSEFYRNANQWETLRKDIIPMLLKKNNQLKIWSAACSTGEEPYSLAMLLQDYLSLNRVKIIATDIDREVLRKAREGVYLEKSLQSLPKSYVKKYFTMEDGLYIIDEKIKKQIEFRQHNLLMDPYPTDCHLIICRNVMIYFTEEAKNQLYPKFRESLEVGGVLFVGSTEHIIFPQKYGFESVKTFFYKKI